MPPSTLKPASSQSKVPGSVQQQMYYAYQTQISNNTDIKSQQNINKSAAELVGPQPPRN